MNATRILGILLEHPSMIEAQTNEYYELVLLEQDTQRAISRLEEKYYSDVHSEELPDGKKAYTNENLRAAEVKRRLSQSEDWMNLKERESNLFKRKHESQAKIERLKKEHTGAVASVRILNQAIEGDE